MARISTYPFDTNIVDNDAWIGSESQNRSTKQFTALDIANYIISSKSVITGSGTLDTIPIFTGTNKIGDSIITYNSAGNYISVGTSLITNLGDNFVSTNTFTGSNLFISNISASGGGNVSLLGNVTIGDQATDVLGIVSAVNDSTGSGSAAAGQVLYSTATGQLIWGNAIAGGTVISVNFKTDGTALNINSNSITTSGTMTGVWQGSSSQYVNGEGDLVTFPTISTGTVTGTGTTNSLPIWTDGPNGVLGDSPITYDSGTPKVSIAVGTNVYTFGEVAFSSSAATGFDFKSTAVNGGFYKAGNFRFERKLAVGRSFDPTGATLDVGVSTDTSPAAWFRNGVVISNNPSGVTVDNTSVVIGAGNNDIVSGSDNCLAVGNNNQVLSNSDHSVALGIGNTLTQGAGASLVVGQGNTIDGTGIPGGSTVRSQVLGLNNNLTGSFASFIAGGSNTVTTEQNAMVLGFSNTTNGLDNVFAIGESNTLNDATANGVFMIGNAITGQDGNMVLGFRNDTSSYPATDYGNGLGNTKLVLSTGTLSNSNAIIITEGGVTRGGGFAQEPRIVMPSIVAFDYADDVAAAAAGIPIGGIYHKDGSLRIRRT